MTENDKYESLEDRFGIEKLDITNRAFAGTYIEGKIYCATEHIAAMRQCQEPLSNRMAFLHLIKNNDKLICFVDAIAIYKVPIDEVVDVIVAQMKEISEVYLFRYPDKITLLYKAMSIEA